MPVLIGKRNGHHTEHSNGPFLFPLSSTLTCWEEARLLLFKAESPKGSWKWLSVLVVDFLSPCFKSMLLVAMVGIWIQAARQPLTTCCTSCSQGREGLGSCRPVLVLCGVVFSPMDPDAV